MGFLAAGIVVGVGAAWAAMGKVHWEKRNWHFQTGYMAGYLDILRYAEAIDPRGPVARDYVVPPKVPLNHWVEEIDRLYTLDEHQNRALSQVIVIAGNELAKRTGYVKGQSPGQVGRMHEFMVRRQERRRQLLIEQAREAALESEGNAGKAPSDAAEKSGKSAVESPAPVKD